MTDTIIVVEEGDRVVFPIEGEGEYVGTVIDVHAPDRVTVAYESRVNTAGDPERQKRERTMSITSVTGTVYPSPVVAREYDA